MKISELKRPIEFFVYSTPSISILWNGKKQPLGMYKTLAEAVEYIQEKKRNGSFGNWSVCVPEIGEVTI